MKTVLIAALTSALTVACFYVLRPAEASRNSAGTMAAVNGPYVGGTTINSAAVNARLSDIENEITNSADRSARGGFLASVRGVDGTVAAPSFSYTSETGSGLYRIGANDHGFAISGTKKLELTSSLFTVTPAASFSSTLAVADVISQTLSGSASNTPLAMFEASLANGNQLLVYLGKSSSNNASGNVSFNSNATAANSTLCMQIQGQASTLCVDGNNKTSTGGNFTIGGSGTLTQGSSGQLTADASGNLATSGTVVTTSSATAAQFLCSTYGASANRCGSASLDGSGNATITVIAGVHACLCSCANVVSPGALGCNVSGTTLTVKGTASQSFNYLCI